jgi:hypothetical protein
MKFSSCELQGYNLGIWHIARIWHQLSGISWTLNENPTYLSAKPKFKNDTPLKLIT